MTDNYHCTKETFMRINPSSQASPQANRWEVPGMDSDTSAKPKYNGAAGESRHSSMYIANNLSEKDKIALEALKTEADKMNSDFYRIMTDKSFLENDLETYKDTFKLDSKAGIGKDFQKLIAKMLESAQIENQQSPKEQDRMNPDCFEASSPDSAWKAFSGK
jgi:hypothetical protein